MPSSKTPPAMYFESAAFFMARSLNPRRQAVATYLNGGNWKIIVEFTEVESGRRADRPQSVAALKATRLHRATIVVSKVDRLTRSVAFLIE